MMIIELSLGAFYYAGRTVGKRGSGWRSTWQEITWKRILSTTPRGRTSLICSASASTPHRLICRPMPSMSWRCCPIGRTAKEGPADPVLRSWIWQVSCILLGMFDLSEPLLEQSERFWYAGSFAPVRQEHWQSVGFRPDGRFWSFNSNAIGSANQDSQGVVVPSFAVFGFSLCVVRVAATSGFLWIFHGFFLDSYCLVTVSRRFVP